MGLALTASWMSGMFPPDEAVGGPRGLEEGTGSASPVCAVLHPRSDCDIAAQAATDSGGAIPFSVSSAMAEFILQMGEAHAAQDVVGLGELDVAVADDLDAVAPGVAEIEERAGQELDAGGDQRLARRVLVVDDRVVAAVVARLAAAPGAR